MYSSRNTPTGTYCSTTYYIELVRPVVTTRTIQCRENSACDAVCKLDVHAPPIQVRGCEFLTDGYIAYAFTQQAASVYLSYLFKLDSAMVKPFFYKGAFFVCHEPTIATLPPLIVNGRPAWLLDHPIRPGGSVVPQEIWLPDLGDWRRYIEQAQLQFPLFFVDADGTIGVPVTDVDAGQMTLDGAQDRVPFGDKTTTKIRVCVCTQPHERAHY